MRCGLHTLADTVLCSVLASKKQPAEYNENNAENLVPFRSPACHRQSNAEACVC